MARSYEEGCGIARALDVIGSRWALLVVRELLLGQLRFSDLRRALPHASTNMLTDRLNELVDSGVIERRRLPPPAGATVYGLTARGRQLEPILAQLGAWGLQVPRPEPAIVTPGSVILFLQGAARPDSEAPELIVRLELEERPFTVIAAHGRVEVTAGEPSSFSASLDCTPHTLNGLLLGEVDLDTARRAGTVAISGDRRALDALLRSARSDQPV
ncbi:MAG TPA: winged helix-turn-helix transcriptional regulator [Protaetiibacter sp.]|nr:winged helix-turn-helix transcriptional regulator [Protaetiibacter sp.]